MRHDCEPFGLSCALATPFSADGSCVADLLIDHARSRLAAGCTSVTLFGTTGEGPSIGAKERTRILQAFKAAGFDFRREVVICCAASALDDCVAQMREALALDCRAILLPPPFYFKNAGEDGLFDWFSACFAGSGPTLRDVILYHIPSVTAVPLPLTLIRRLTDAYPAIVHGVKDSGGEWDYSSALVAGCPDLTVLVGDERHLGQAVGMGAEGAISGTANFIPDVLRAMIAAGRADARVTSLVEEILRFPVTPAVKALVAHRSGNAAWMRVAPPLRALGDADARKLSARYDALFRPAADKVA